MLLVEPARGSSAQSPMSVLGAVNEVANGVIHDRRVDELSRAIAVRKQVLLVALECKTLCREEKSVFALEPKRCDGRLAGR